MAHLTQPGEAPVFSRPQQRPVTVPVVMFIGQNSAPCPQQSSRTKTVTPVLAAMFLQLQKEDPLLRSPQILPRGLQDTVECPGCVTSRQEVNSVLPVWVAETGRCGRPLGPWGTGIPSPYFCCPFPSSLSPADPETWQNPTKPASGKRGMLGKGWELTELQSRCWSQQGSRG